MQHTCPACGEETEHEIVKEGHELLVRCTVCGGVHRVPRPKEPRIIAVRTVVSHEKESRVCSIELLDDEMCSVGDLLVAECDDDVMGVEVTSIERAGARVSKARAAEIQTVWSRLVEQVIVKASVHDGRTTLPLYIPVAGEEDFIVGSVYLAGRIRFRITRIKLRDGALMKKEGWKAYARKIKRIYGIRI